MNLSAKDQLVNLVFFHKLYLCVKLDPDVSIFSKRRSPYELAILYPEKGTVRADGTEPVAAIESRAKRLLVGNKFVINPDKTISFVADNYTPPSDNSSAKAHSFKDLTRLVFIKELVPWSKNLAQGHGLLLSTLRESVPGDITDINGEKISLSSRTQLGFFPMEDLRDTEYKKLLAATQHDKGYRPIEAAKKIQQLFESFQFIKANASNSMQLIAAADAKNTPGLKNYYSDPSNKSSYPGMLTENDFKEILGDLMVTTGDIKSEGAYIIPVTAKDKKAIYEKIDDIIKVYSTKNIKGEVTVHMPLSTGYHFTLLSLKINRDDKGHPQITEIEHSDSVGASRTKVSKLKDENYKTFFSGILQLCPLNLFAPDCNFLTVNRNAQGANLYCGDYTIQEALRKTGKKLGAITFDQSQDLEHGDKLRAATTALVRDRIAKKPHIAQSLSRAELEVVANVHASFKAGATTKITSAPIVVAQKTPQKKAVAKTTVPKSVPQKVEQKGIMNATKSLLLLPFTIVDFVGDSLSSAGAKLLKGIVSAINLPFVIVNFVGDALRAGGTKLHKTIVPAKIEQQEKSVVSAPVNGKQQQKSSPRTPKIIPPLSAKSAASSSVVKPVLALAPAVKTAKISAVSSKACCTDKQGTQMSKTAPAPAH